MSESGQGQERAEAAWQNGLLHMTTLEQRGRMLILLVEDREDDVVLFRRALALAGVENPVFAVRNGQMAARYLAGVGAYRNHAEFPLPDLMVVDLKMPGMDGFELIGWVREQPWLRAMRIVVLTSSEDAADLQRCADLGANSFLVKPFEFQDYIEMARELGKHWMDQSMAPQIFRPARGGRTERDDAW